VDEVHQFAFTTEGGKRQHRHREHRLGGLPGGRRGDDEVTALHHTNNQAWRQRVARLVSAVAPGWTNEQVATAVFALIAMAEGAAALASADPTAYPPAAQVAALDARLSALAVPRSLGSYRGRFCRPGSRHRAA
jgi:hypothetical protein